jgi:hypothetical protein
VNKVYKDLLVSLVQLDPQERLDPQALPDQQDRRALRVLLELQELPAPQDHKVRLVNRAFKDLPALQERLVLRVLKALLVLRVLRVSKGFKDRLV